MPQIPKVKGVGLVKGLGVTMKEVVHTMFPKRGALTPIPSPTRGAVTVQYPHEKEDPAPRARGVIALLEENCTVCMLCARSCPDWCIYIEGHKEKAPPRRPGGKPRTVSALDRFDIDADYMNVLGPIILLTKIIVLGGIAFWVRFTYPRLREDQLQRFAWTVLIPVSLVNILVTMVLKVAF